MRVAIYVRVSTQRQAQTQTIAQQLDRLRASIEERGWTLLDHHIFRDDGYSGASLRRPGLDRLREAVAAGAVDRVILTAPDRLARNYVHQVLLLEELGHTGCEIEFLDRPMSNDPHDQLLLQIRGAVAEYERSIIAERMRRGRQAKLRAGLLLPWTRAPYGYRLDAERPRDPTGVRVELAEAAMVTEIFARYLDDGMGLLGLAKALGRAGIATPNGHARWNTATLRGMLTNPCYTGQVYAGRTRAQPPRIRRSALHPIGRPGTTQAPTPPEEWVLVANIPALVSEEQFAQVQAKLARNRQFARRNNTAHDYLLRALVSCGVCQVACTGRSDRRHRYDYYVCRAKANPVASRREVHCPARYIPAHQLDDLVWQDLCAVLAHPESIAQALARAQGGHWSSQEMQARREVLRKGRVSLEQQRERLTDAYLRGVMPLAEYQRRRGELEQKADGLTQQMHQLVGQTARQADVARQVRGAEAFCQRVQAGLADASFVQRRQLVELLIDRVVVTDAEVEIRYVVPTSPHGEQSRFCHLRLDYFDLPMPSYERAQPSRIRDSGRQAGDTVAYRLLLFPALPPRPLNQHHLRHPRPIEITSQFRRGNQVAHFKATMPFIHRRRFPHVPRRQTGSGKGGISAGSEQRGNRVPQGRLVLLDNHEVIAHRVDDRRAKVAVTIERVARDDALRPIEAGDQRWGGDQFGFRLLPGVIERCLGEDNAEVMQHRTEHLPRGRPTGYSGWSAQARRPRCALPSKATPLLPRTGVSAGGAGAKQAVRAIARGSGSS